MTPALRRSTLAASTSLGLLAASCGLVGDDSGFAGCSNDTDDLDVAHASFVSEVTGAQGVAGGDGRFWIVTDEDRVVELDASTGAELRAFDDASLEWEADPTNWASPGAAAFSESTLYIGDRNVVAIDIAGDADLTARQVEFGATFSDISVFAGFAVGDASIAAIDIDSGSVRYAPIADGEVVGEFLAIPNSSNAVDVAVLDDAVFWTDGTGRLRQYDPATEATITAARLDDVSALAAARDHLVVVMGGGQRIAVFQPSTGALATAGFGLGTRLTAPQMASDGCSVWVTSQSSLLLTNDPNAEVCIDGCLLRLDPESGDVLAVVELEGRTGGPGLAVADGRVLVLGTLLDDPANGNGIDSSVFNATYVDDSLSTS